MTPEERAHELLRDMVVSGLGARETTNLIRECVCAAIAEEREACAKIADAHEEARYPHCAGIAAAIRART